MRGKYSINNKHYIKNMVKQMTVQEKHDLKTMEFDDLWRKLWNIPDSAPMAIADSPPITQPTIGRTRYSQNEMYHNEELKSKDKFNILKDGVRFVNTHTVVANTYTEIDEMDRVFLNSRGGGGGRFLLKPTLDETVTYEPYSISSIIDECECYEQWDEPEWGFPKGRRNNQEKDYETAVREFSEETGVISRYLRNIQNIYPFEENIMGSNYKSYKHKYYLMYIEYGDSLKTVPFEKGEVSKVEWKTYDECIQCIRFYNLEKKRIIFNIHQCLTKYSLYV